MRLLYDQNLSHRLVDLLDDLYPDSLHVRMIAMQRSDDRPIYNYAKEHGFTVVTLDKDYGNLVTVHGFPPKVIWLRCGNSSTEIVAGILQTNYLTIQHFSRSGTSGLIELR